MQLIGCFCSWCVCVYVCVFALCTFHSNKSFTRYIDIELIIEWRPCKTTRMHIARTHTQNLQKAHNQMFQYLCIWNFQQPSNILPLLIPRFISIWLYAFIITEKSRLSQKKQWHETSPHCIHNIPHMVYIDFIKGHLQASRFTSHFYLITFQSNLMIIQQYLCIYYSKITCLLLFYQLYS